MGETRMQIVIFTCNASKAQNEKKNISHVFYFFPTMCFSRCVISGASLTAENYWYYLTWPELLAGFCYLCICFGSWLLWKSSKNRSNSTEAHKVGVKNNPGNIREYTFTPVTNQTFQLLIQLFQSCTMSESNSLPAGIKHKLYVGVMLRKWSDAGIFSCGQTTDHLKAVFYIHPHII